MPKAVTALTPALVTLGAVAVFLLVLNFAITKPEGTRNKNQDTHTAGTALANSSESNVNDTPGANANTNATTSNTNAEPEHSHASFPAPAKLFTSADLGIQFYYNPTKPEETAVTQIGNTVYVYPSSYTDPKAGQFVEVMSKDAGDDLATAIRKKFLNSISASDCFVTSLETTGFRSSQSAAIIDFPLADPENDPFGANSKCPKNYQKTNGQRYFLSDTREPTKLFFFSLGQYAIMVDSEHTWQDTLEFLPAE